MSEFNLPLSQRWVQSVESETMPGFVELGERVAKETSWTQLREYIPIYPDSEVLENVAADVLGLPYYKEASPSEKRKIEAALFGEAYWVYATQPSIDGLWKDEDTSLAAPVDASSRIVLSGALGDSIFRENPSLLTMTEKYKTTYLNRAILVGGAAVAAITEEVQLGGAGGYYTSPHISERLQWQTFTGGSFHGDFRTSRSARPVGSIKDTIDGNREHHFMPAIYNEAAAAYHSTELGIIWALLFHLVINRGVDRSALFQTLQERLKTLNIHAGGPFADYGSNDGEYEARELYENLRRSKPATYGSIYTAIVHPGGDRPERFHVNLQPEGVVMLNTSKGVEESRMVIPNGEIEDYIVALISGGGGRTSPQAMGRVADALIAVREEM